MKSPQHKILPPYKGQGVLVFPNFMPIKVHAVKSIPSRRRRFSSFLTYVHAYHPEKVRDASGNVITEGFFYVGAEVTFHGHCFRITAADDKTLRLMEERAAAPGGFVHSDAVRAAELLAGWVEGRAGEVRTYLRERDLKVGGAGGSRRVRGRDKLGLLQ